MTRTDGIGSIIDITEGGTKQFGFQGADTSDGILVEEGIPSNGHFNFCPLNQIHRGVQCFEFFQSENGIE